MNMKKYSHLSDTGDLPEGTVIDDNVTIGRGVTIAGGGVVLRGNARLDPACVIGEGVTVGQNAWVRAGAVVLQSVPPNAIVEGNPAQVVGYRRDPCNGDLPAVKHFDIHQFINNPRPARDAQGV